MLNAPWLGVTSSLLYAESRRNGTAGFGFCSRYEVKKRPRPNRGECVLPPVDRDDSARVFFRVRGCVHEEEDAPCIDYAVFFIFDLEVEPAFHSSRRASQRVLDPEYHRWI